MGRMKTDKQFDCIKHKRQAQARIYREIRGLTPSEEAAYFARTAESGPLGEWWKRVKARQR
jgi:hypothetical protein